MKEPTAAQIKAAGDARKASAKAVLDHFEHLKRPKAPAKVPCPFVSKGGKPCKGHVVRVEAYKADIEWSLNDDGTWSFGVGEPRSHYHLFCSERGNHAGFGRPDADEMKFYFGDLPATLRQVLDSR